jgi:hypothetical protein
VFNGLWSVLCHAMLRCDILYQDVKAYIPSFDMQRRLDESYVAILNHMYPANRICFSYCRYLPIRLVQMVPLFSTLNGRSRLSRFPMSSALRLQMFRGSTTISPHSIDSLTLSGLFIGIPGILRILQSYFHARRDTLENQQQTRPRHRLNLALGISPPSDSTIC